MYLATSQLRDHLTLHISTFHSKVFIPKVEENFWPVVLLCALDHKIKVQLFLFPDVHLCFLWFSCAKLFTSVDLNLAYHHIDLTE